MKNTNLKANTPILLLGSNTALTLIKTLSKKPASQGASQ